MGLGARERAVLLRAGDQQVLLGVANGSVRFLCECAAASSRRLAGDGTIDRAAPGTRPRRRSARPSVTCCCGALANEPPTRSARSPCCWWCWPPLAAHAAAPALAAVASQAAPGIPAVTVHASGGGQTYTLTIQLLVLMTAITLLPAVLLMMTAFTRIIIVLSILRQAIGAGQSPPNQVLIGLALFLTLFVMSPVIDKIRTDAVTPYMAGSIDADSGARARRRAAQDLHARADARERHRRCSCASPAARASTARRTCR